ncbi:MAG: bifunctional 5,10-methylenetetrahydrofolate dehydrogenase/5,10-methenyltetrahydrofolate cyclohydrolase [Flavobacteriales bacterium AspAUS03]
MTQLLDGKALAQQLRQEIAEEVQQLKMQGKHPPHLVAVLVGDDDASMAYVNSKVKDCKSVGFQSSLMHFPVTISEGELLEEVRKLNEAPSVDGFIVQLPLPEQIDQEKIIIAINPDKDVDGFHPMNFGKMALEMPAFIPATPFGILILLERYQIQTRSKHTVVIGRSRIVGKPISLLMGRKGIPGDSTVTLTHSHTSEVIHFSRMADIVITALGVPGFLKAEMIKEGAVVIDVGISRVVDPSSPKSYRLVGDVDFKSVYGKASYLTPVPGGVGPMTRAMLLKNTLLAVNRRHLSHL